MRISQAEAALFRAGFTALSRDRAAAAQSFYAHLFRIAPETRDLFVTDLDRQGAKLMDTLAVVAQQVDNWGLLRTALEDLALRHTAYGVKPAHYALTGAALLAMLHDRLGDACTPEMEAVWQHIYSQIETVMIGAAYRLHADDPA
jgi:hemoglobin-like flavoprotein